MRYFCRRLLLPDSIREAILPIADMLVKRFVCESEEEFVRVIFPNTELWAVSAIYVSLISLELTLISQEFTDCIAKWTLFLEAWNFRKEIELKIESWNRLSQKYGTKKTASSMRYLKEFKMRQEIGKSVPKVESDFEEEKQSFLSATQALQIERKQNIKVPVNGEGQFQYIHTC